VQPVPWSVVPGRASKTVWAWVPALAVLAACPVDEAVFPSYDETGAPSQSTSLGTSASTNDDNDHHEDGPPPSSDSGDASDDESSSSGSQEHGGCMVFCESPDGGSVHYECDIWMQDDCGPGLKCLPWANDGGKSWNAPRCSPLDPHPRAPGEPCMVEGSAFTGIDDCELGAMCWNVDAETNEGECVAFCDGTPDNAVCDDPDTTCVMSHEGVLNLCLPEPPP